MKAIAFAPGHISGFFEPVYCQGLSKTGSRGAGINISSGAISEVTIKPSKNQIFEFYVNNKEIKSPVVELAIKYLIGKTPIHILSKTKLELPIGQGFGMSSASALSTTYALAKLLKLSETDAMKASHFAEVQLRTGLGDVIASCFGGIEIRKEPGLPPWGVIEHIPGKYDLVLCIIGKKLDTKKILTDTSKINDILNYGKYCTKKLLEKPCIENLLLYSQVFAKKTNLANKSVLEAIESASNYGMASMCMLGNSVFAIGKTNELSQILSKYGKVFVCKTDEFGARVINE